jgi:hypothetical protein
MRPWQIAITSIAGVIVMVYLLYRLTELCLVYVFRALPMRSVIWVNEMYVKPLDQIPLHHGELFLNLHPSHYGIYMCPFWNKHCKPILVSSVDIGKTVLVSNGAYTGSQFTIALGRVTNSGISVEYIPMLGGEPKSWINQLVSDLREVAKLPNADNQLSQVIDALINNLSINSIPDTSTNTTTTNNTGVIGPTTNNINNTEVVNASLVVTTTGKRKLQVNDIFDVDGSEISLMWAYIKEAMQMTYEMTGEPIS